MDVKRSSHSSCRRRLVSPEVEEKIKYYQKQGCIVPNRKLLKTPEQIDGIRASSKINVAVLDYIAQNIRPGITTAQIDRWVYQMTTDFGALPAPLGYEGFPKSVCTSVNEVVCHGIPSKKEVLREGDIVNVDVSTLYKGYYSDSSRMFCIGEVPPEKKKLVEVTQKCVELGLAQVKPWQFLGDMGEAVHRHAQTGGYSVVREIGGHGIGLQFHEEPWVSYVSRKGTGMLMVPGMIFTIEPMVNMGRAGVFVSASDGWTVYTADRKPSAQWEITVLVTEEGNEVLAW